MRPGHHIAGRLRSDWTQQKIAGWVSLDKKSVSDPEDDPARAASILAGHMLPVNGLVLNCEGS